MPDFIEGVRIGGLTTSAEVRVLLCYLLDGVSVPLSRAQIEEALLGEELVNYFSLAEGLAQLCSQKLAVRKNTGYLITDEGRTVARTLSRSVPFSIREAALRSVVRIQLYVAKAAAHQCDVVKTGNGDGRFVRCSIGDDAGTLFKLDIYTPDSLSAEAVRRRFVDAGDDVYKLVLAALTGNRAMAEKALGALRSAGEKD